MPATRPNFLLVMTDQHRADHLGCYGNPIVRTPSLDRVSSSGWTFDQCFVTTPVCMPNRASFLTGRMPSLHGVRHNGIPLSLGATTFVDLLRADGYATALIGKCHFQNMEDHPPRLARRPDDSLRRVAGFEEARGEDLHGPSYRQELASSWREPDHRLTTPYYGFDHVDLCDEHGDLVFGDYSRWLERTDPIAFAQRGEEGALSAEIVAPQAWRTCIPEDEYPTAYIGTRAIEFLGRQAKARDRQPFFLMCSFPDPHHPFTPPGRYWDMYDPARIPLPSSFRSDPDTMSKALAWLHRERVAGRSPRNAHRVLAVTAEEARQAIALTYGMISMVDDVVGRILQSLETLGLADDTVVIFTSDHGDFMGDHGLLLKGPLHYRGVIRVPLIWRDPRQTKAARSNLLASTIDLPTSILHRAGLACPNGMQGLGLPDLMNGARPRDAVLIEDDAQRAFLGFRNPIRVRTLVTHETRLSLYGEDGAGEMYDLAADPYELHDLWSEPAAADRRATATERLARLMLEHGDTSPLPTGLA